MQEQDTGGVIINIASVSGTRPTPGTAAYGAAKAGLLSLTQTLAVEWAPKVRVNAIAPGLIKTDFARALWEGEGADRVIASYPLKRLGEPEDVAAAATFLAADSGSWITGQTLVLDGGGLVAFRR